MTRAWLIALLLCCPLSAMAVPFWGAKQSSPVETPSAQLQPGEWIWDGDSAPDGPMAVVVSLTEQRAYAYRNGLLVAHEDPKSLADALERVLTDERLGERLAKAGRRDANTQYTLGRMISRYEALFDQILAAGPHAARAGVQGKKGVAKP